MKLFPLLALVVLAAPLCAQTSQADLYAMESSPVAAELTAKIDSKNAKVGDAILARTTRDARISDGSRLPMGTKLTGKIIEVRAKSDADKTAHLALTLDRAVLRDGTEVHLHVTLTGMSADTTGSQGRPTTSATNADTNDFSAPSGGRGSGNSSRATTGNALAKSAGNDLSGAADAALERSHPVADAGTSVSDTTNLRLRRVPVAGMPGVILSSSVRSQTSGSLDASGRNITLESGTQLMLSVIATQ